MSSYETGDATLYNEFLEEDKNYLEKVISDINTAVSGTGTANIDAWTKLSSALTNANTSIAQAIEMLTSYEGDIEKMLNDNTTAEAAAAESYNKSTLDTQNKLELLKEQLEKLKIDCANNDDEDNEIDFDGEIDKANKEIEDLQLKINNLGSPGVEMGPCAGLVSEPYAEYRSLDIYYKTPGHNGEWSTETVTSILY